MSLILNIDTALETASISLARDGRIIEQSTNDKQKDHALTRLHPAVDELFQKTNMRLQQLEAVAVSNEWSYTGLRLDSQQPKGIALHWAFR